MSRQSQTNTFNNGLNKDLNPVLTPNTVMTDCLNGTIITYNGNEFALQNDLGNYKFKHGSLSDGFVPVGIKEHANILYIISYNPITDEVEIGSFPSTKTINTSIINNGKDPDVNIELKNKYNKYSSITTELTLLSDLTEDFLLNPGDKYILSTNVGENSDNTNKESILENAWMNTSYYVFTENKKLYNIDDYIITNTNVKDAYNSGDFNSIKWETPGWLAVKPTINVMNEFNCYIDDITYSGYKNGKSELTSATIKIQSIWDSKKYENIIDDYNLGNNNLSILHNLGYCIYAYDDNNSDNINWEEIIDDKNKNITLAFDDLSKPDSSILNSSIRYNDIHDVIYSSITLTDCKENYLAVVPILRVNDENGEIKYIIYDQFTTILKLSKSRFDPESVKIGDGLFKYYVGERSLTINMNVNSNSNCRLFYKILTWDNKGGIQECFNWEELTEFDYNGQNIFSIDYDDIGFDTGYHFEKEDFYIIKFYVTADDNIDINNIDFNIENPYCKEFIIYCSEYVNIYYKIYDHYYSDEFMLNEETFSEAVGKGLKISNPIVQDPLSYNESNINLVSYVNNLDTITKEFIYDNEEEKIKNNDFENEITDKYFVQDYNKSEFNKYLLYKYGTTYKWSFDTEIKFIKPKGSGRLWNDIENPNVENLQIFAYNDELDQIMLNSSIGDDNTIYYSLPVASESKIYIDPNIETKSGPNRDTEMSFEDFGDDPPVSMDKDGWWKLNKVAVIWKYDYKKDFSTGYVEPTKEIKFKVIDSETIDVKVGEEKCQLINSGNTWMWNKESDNKNFWECFYLNNAVFEINDYSWSKNTPFSKQSIESYIYCPWFVILYNNINSGGNYYRMPDTTDDKYFDGFPYFEAHFDSIIANTKVPFLKENYHNSTFTEGCRQLAVIGMPISQYDNDNFSAIFITDNENRWKPGAQDQEEYEKIELYINELFAIYFLMVDRIRYCKEIASIIYYLLNFDSKHNIVDKMNIKSIEYRLTDISINYLNTDLISGDIHTINIKEIKDKIHNLTISDENNLNKIFYNWCNNIQTAIDKYKDYLNDKIITEGNLDQIKDLRVFSNGFFLTNDSNDYNIQKLVENWFDIEGDRIIYKSPNTWSHYLWTKYKSGDSIDNYLKIASVNPFYLDR